MLTTRPFSIWKYLGLIPTTVTKNKKCDEKFVSIMKDGHLKTQLEPTPEVSCILSIPQIVDSVRHNIFIMNWPLSKSLENQF
jgi:hypothetical protein